MLAQAGISVGAAPVRPGVELGWYYVFLHNAVSRRSRSVDRASQSGVGRVVSVTEVQIAPLRIGYHRRGQGWRAGWAL
jgi:hypothetical protein